MFKHILLPTDGSANSRNAIEECIKFAKLCGAHVIGLHIIPDFHIFMHRSGMAEESREQFDKDCIAQARKVLAEVEAVAREAGVRCDTLYVNCDHPHEEIVKIARDKRCDLIAMASHGRKGMQGFLLGSETQKVLTHSDIPVLVFRAAPATPAAAILAELGTPL